MSLKAKQAVIEDSPSRGNNRLVLMAIADCANDHGTDAFPSQEYIAQWANCSVRTVQRAIQELVEAGDLRVERESTRSVNYYTVMAAWNRHFGLQQPPAEDTRQPVGCKPDRPLRPKESGGNSHQSVADSETDDNLTGVTRHDVGDKLTRQPDGGHEATPARSDGSDATLVAGQIRSLTDLSPTHARPDKLSGVSNRPRQGSIIGRGEGVNWHRLMERQHANCHPEICKWRDSKVRECMPMALVSRYAQKLHGLTDDAAHADVVAWARADVPPAEYVAPGDVYEHWRIRWDLTRAKAPGARLSANAGAETTVRVPGAAETDALIKEMTGGRA